MQQGAVHSSPLPNPITRAMKRYSPVSFWPWLLAYLFLSSVAIVLASPFGPDLDQSSRALPDLNSYPPDVGENLLDLHLYPHEVGESSLETVQSTTTQDGNPHKRTIWTLEDKKDLEIFDYRPHVPLPDMPDQHWLLFQSDFGKEYACAPNYQKTRRKHPELSLTLMRSAVDQVPEHQVLRISYLNAPGKLLPSDAVRARQRMLLAYLYKLHQRVLARCDHLTDSTKDWLHDSLFKWIHRNLFQPQAEPYLLPIIGIVHDTQLTWENMAATYRFTQTQKDLLTYFSDGTKEAVVTATLKLVQTFTDQHKDYSSH